MIVDHSAARAAYWRSTAWGYLPCRVTGIRHELDLFDALELAPELAAGRVERPGITMIGEEQHAADGSEPEAGTERQLDWGW